MRTLTVVRQYLAAAFLLMIGLVAYGCGDSASVGEPAALGNLSVSPGTLQPPFDPATTNYTAKISSNVSSTTLTATPRVAGDSIQIDNQQITNRTVTLVSPGDKTTVTIVVTDTGTGGTSKSYIVEVERETEDTTLQALSVSPGTLAPSTFDKDRPDYTVNDIANTVTSIALSATKSDPNTVMQINSPSGSVDVPAGTALGQATVRLGGPGSATTVSIVVTAQRGSSNTYTVTINRGPSDNKFLRSLSIASGSTALTLVPRFNQTAPDYTVNVASTIGSVSVTARLDDETTARMTVNGVATDSRDRRTITLNPAGPGPGPSRTPIPIVVTAQNGSQQTYTVTVIRAALNGNNDLRSLTVSPGNLTFDPDDQDYTVSLLSGVTSARITAAPQDSNARVTINGQPNPTNIDLGAPGPETRITIPIVVTAQNNDTKTYNVTVIRAALGGNFNLRSLTVRSHTLVPPFSQSRARTDYDLSVINSVGSIIVDATPQDDDASVRFLVNGAASTNSISLPSGPSTTEIEVFVRAPNGTEKPYSITVDRAAPSSNNNLSDLNVRAGNTAQTLSPSFAAGTLAYTVNVAGSVNEVTVAATKADSNATMAIGSVTVPPGTPTGETTVPVNTILSIAVTAPSGGTPKTYTVTARQGPTAAPDLLQDDDSCAPGIPDPAVCAPGTSKDDNVTNVTTPRFSISRPVPDNGETATLYINGEKDASSSTTGNILTPSTSLGDDTYDITYTITNAVGESGPSPVMTPKLRIDTTPLGGGGSTP